VSEQYLNSLPTLLASVAKIRYGAGGGVARSIDETALMLRMLPERVAIFDSLITDGSTPKRSVEERLTSFLIRAKAVVYLRNGLDGGDHMSDAEVATVVGWPLERVKAVMKAVL